MIVLWKAWDGGVEPSRRPCSPVHRFTIAVWRPTSTVRRVETYELAEAADRIGVGDVVFGMCFLGITGYTRLTQKRGDAAAAQLAEGLGRLAQQTSVKHGGRAVKWLGDGVMLHCPNPGPGVVAALEMVAGAAEAGLPPAHVGLHAGPVIFQEGDHHGQTVSLASRIADDAPPGEVIVS